MEIVIFKIFVFCMFIVLGVLILGLLKWIFKFVKLCYQHIFWKIRVLIIFPLSILIFIFWLIIESSFRKDQPELLIAIILGCVGSHYIFKDQENN
tara:strand:+ start:1795 stop:2079 length:285 start_codon:yes stop_codon:yes gene_type:complete